MDEYQTPVSRTQQGRVHLNTLVPVGICFVYVQLRDDTTEQILADTPYVVRGLLHGTSISGTSDKDGVLRHEYLRVDHYELESRGVTEPIETYYMDRIQDYTDKPWVLRLRSEE
jgi:hypothetical protein